MSAVLALTLLHEMPAVGAAAEEATTPDPAVNEAPKESREAAIEPVEVGPVEELTTEDSVTVREEGGTYTTTIYGSAVNYQDESGDWEPISNDLVETEGDRFAAENEANSYTVQIPENPANTPVKMEEDGNWVKLKMVGVEDVEPDIEAAEAIFEDIAGADEIIYEATESGLKETIILEGAPTVPPVYEYRLTVSSKLTPVLTEDQMVEFRAPDGTVELFIPVGIMNDSTAPEPEYTNAVRYEIEPWGGEKEAWRFTITPDLEWLTDPARVYPVAIDPTVSKNTQKSCWLNQSSVSTTHCGDTKTKVGADNNLKRRRGLLDFSLSGIPSNAVISDAKAMLYLNAGWTTGSGGATSYALYHPSYDWGNCASWKYACKNGRQWSGGSPSGQISSNTHSLGGSSSGWKSFNISNRVKGWLATPPTFNYHGVMIRQVSENTKKILGFVSSNHWNTNLRPYLSISYSIPRDPNVVTDAEVQRIIELSDLGTTEGEVRALIDEGVTSNEGTGDPYTHQQAAADVIAILEDAQTGPQASPEMESEPVTTNNCDWVVEIDASDDSVSVARQGTPAELAPDDVSDPTAPIYAGAVEGETVTVQVYRGTPADEVRATLTAHEAELPGLAQQSGIEAVDETGSTIDMDHEDNLETLSPTEMATSDNLEVVAYSLQTDQGHLERGVPAESATSAPTVARGGDGASGACTASSAGSDSEVALSSASAEVVIPTLDEALQDRSYPKTSSAFRYRTFIPSAEVSAYAICGKFAGDDRSWTSYYKAPNRTRISVFFNWPTGTLDVGKHIGVTHRLGSWHFTGTGIRYFSEKKKRASSKGIRFHNAKKVTKPNGAARYMSVYVDHAVPNPMCKIGGNVSYNIHVSRWRGGVARITGTRKKVPAHEAYVYPHTEAYGKKLIRRSSSSFFCLAPLICGVEEIGGEWSP
ncbi:DNRLRE domain-containing protein [Nocardioides salsibiostraticola]